MALSYSAWWIWDNRNSLESKRDIAGIVAVEMPLLWIQFCMFAFLICRIYLHEVRRLEVEAGKLKPKTRNWRDEVLAILLVFGTMIPAMIAGHHALFLPFMFVCWVLAFVAWGVLGLVSWSMGRLFDRQTKVWTAADQVAASDGNPPSRDGPTGAVHSPDKHMN